MTPAAAAAALPPILVVDDNHDNAEIIRQYLQVRGYPVTVAHGGDEALSLFEVVKPALVLLDVMMPGRDGWEVCRLMKQHPVLGPRVRVVMVTASISGRISGRRCKPARTITSRSRLTCRRWRPRYNGISRCGVRRHPDLFAGPL
jgi:CheY-like chemotaxis protein